MIVFLKHKKSEFIWLPHQIFITLHPEINNILSRDEKVNIIKVYEEFSEESMLEPYFPNTDSDGGKRYRKRKRQELSDV